MSDTSAIEWTDTTWNPTTGCDRISAGCDNCYALTMAKRLKGMGSAKYQNDGDPRTSGPGFGLTVHADTLRDPFKWRKPRKVFVNSMSDLFHARVPLDFVRQVFEVMEATPQHTYQVLTKRASRLPKLADELPWPPNVWLGVSVEDQQRADERIPALLKTPAAVRFLSCEPLLGAVDLSRYVCSHYALDRRADDPSRWVCDCGLDTGMDGVRPLRPPAVDWVIVGGESGPGARPMHPDWARDLRDQCAPTGVPFFFKQWGEWGPAPWSVRIPEPAGGWPAADPDWLAAEKAAAEQIGATHHIMPSGHLYEPDHKPWSLERDPDGHYPGAVRRYGKKAAGRELDGRTWDEYPGSVS